MANVGIHQAQRATFKYKFADQGGTVGVITLDGVGNGNNDGTIPDNAIILGATLEPITALTCVDATGTVKIGITGNDDAFLAATQFDDATFVPEEPISIAADLPVKTAAAVSVIATVGGTAPSITHNTTVAGDGSHDEIQTITVAHADGGTMTWTYSGQTTTPLAYGISAADAQTALEALSNIAPGDIVVTKLADVYTITVQPGGALHFTNIAQLTSSATGLTSDNDLTAGEFDVHVEYLPGR